MNIRSFVPRMREEMRHRHPAAKQQVQGRIRQKPKFGNETIARRPMRTSVLEHLSRLARRLQGLAQHDDVEGAARIGGEIPIGITPE